MPIGDGWCARWGVDRATCADIILPVCCGARFKINVGVIRCLAYGMKTECYKGYKSEFSKVHCAGFGVNNVVFIQTQLACQNISKYSNYFFLKSDSPLQKAYSTYKDSLRAV